MNVVGSSGRAPSPGEAPRPRGPSGDAGTLFVHPHTPISLLLAPGTANGQSPRGQMGERRRNPLVKQRMSEVGKRGDPGAREPETCGEGRGAAGRTPVRPCPAAAPRGEGRREGSGRAEGAGGGSALTLPPRGAAARSSSRRRRRRRGAAAMPRCCCRCRGGGGGSAAHQRRQRARRGPRSAARHGWGS